METTMNRPTPLRVISLYQPYALTGGEKPQAKRAREDYEKRNPPKPVARQAADAKRIAQATVNSTPATRKGFATRIRFAPGIPIKK